MWKFPLLTPIKNKTVPPTKSFHNRRYNKIMHELNSILKQKNTRGRIPATGVLIFYAYSWK